MYKISLLAIFILTTIVGWSIDVYVSPTGSDINTGAIDSPLKTLAAAFEKVKGQASGKTIWLRGGIYSIPETITADTQHSGGAGAPLRICAYQDEEVIINGGTVIPSSKFRVLTNSVRLERIPEGARGKVYVAQLYESTYVGLFPSKDEYNKSALLSWDGYVLSEAKYPNRGYGYIETVLDVGPSTRWLAPGEQPPAYSESNPTGGKFMLRDQLDWTMMKDEFDRTHDMQIRGYFSNDWYYQEERIGDIEAGGTIQLLRYTKYGVEDTQALPRRVNIVGALCQLDEPGEWYFDKADNLLYFWPVQQITDDKPVSVTGSHKLINCETRIENVQFENLIFENFSDHAIRFTNAGNVKVLGCEFRGGDGVGVRLAGNNNLIRSCDFHDCKQGFVLGDANSNDVKNLVHSHNEAVNNHLHHLWHRGYGAFAVSGVGARFANNLVHDMNGALVYGTVDCVVEYNEFYDMGNEMGDWNPMYRGADFTSLGNEVRYNYIHHLMETPSGYPIAGIRNDDFGHGLHVEHNVFYKSGRAATMFSGANNSASHNIVLETNMIWWSNQVPYEALDKSLWDSKGDYLQRRYQSYLEDQAKIAAGELNPNEKLNYLGRAEILLGKEFWNSNQLWKEHFPIINNLYHFDDPDRNPWMQCYDTLMNNVMVNGKTYPYHMHGPNKVDEGGIQSLRDWLPNTAYVDMPVRKTIDEVFVDFAAGDLTMKSSFNLIDGFIDFNMDTIGLFVDGYRKTMPDKEKYRKAVMQKYNGIPSSGGTFDYDKLNERYSSPGYLDLLTTGNSIKYQRSTLIQLRYDADNIQVHAVNDTRNSQLEVYNINGIKILYQDVDGFPVFISKSQMAPGVYLLYISSDDGCQTKKFVVE